MGDGITKVEDRLLVTVNAPICMTMSKFFVAFCLLAMLVSPGWAETKTILALGDSLTAGYGLDPPLAFPVRLEAALKAKGHDVTVINGGVSGDTVAQGEARLDWVLTDDVDAVIVELGANDALRGLDPAQIEQALLSILTKIKTRGLPVLLAGMKAPPNMGPDYVAAFDGIYLRLAENNGALLYPFYLEGVAADAKLNQADGIHPNGPGVDVIVNRMLPAVEGLLAQTK
jgi:acyl-CoA thioesterase I